jgi:hypothetical protein
MMALGEQVMPNDAKFGLLAGVIGVIAAAVLSTNPPALRDPSGSVSTSSHPMVSPTSAIPEPVVQPRNNIPHSRQETNGTPVNHKSSDDIDP